MLKLSVLIIVLVWICLPTILSLRAFSNRKRKQTIYGRLYVPKTHKNSGSNPCDHTIESINPIEIPGAGNCLYVSK